MEKMILRQLGNVMKFGDFCKSVNERMEVEVMTPDDVIVIHDYQEVMDAVGSLIERVSGWDFAILMKHIGEEYQLEYVSEEDLVMWVHQQVQDYFKPDVEIRGEVGAIKKGKESDFTIALQQLDFGMCVEKIIRQLKGLEENDEKYPPGYFKKMADIMDEYITDGKEAEE